MTSQYRTAPAPVQWGLASQAFSGETALGDLHLVKTHADGALAAVIDGIGHGEEAAAASKLAAASMQEHPQESPAHLLRLSHEALVGTRGAVAGVATICYSKNNLTWCGVGNIDGVLLRANRFPQRQSLVASNGTLGHQLPWLHMVEVSLEPGDVLVMATDGIRTGFAEHIFPRHAPQQIATEVLQQFATGKDDALVLVVRYVGRMS